MNKISYRLLDTLSASNLSPIRVLRAAADGMISHRFRRITNINAHGRRKDGAVYRNSGAPTPSPNEAGWAKKTCLVTAAAIAVACAYVAPPAGAEPAQTTPPSSEVVILCKSTYLTLRSNNMNSREPINVRYELAINEALGAVRLINNTLDYIDYATTRANMDAQTISFDTTDGIVGVAQHFHINRTTGEFELSWHLNYNKSALHANIEGACTGPAQALRYFGEF